MPRDGLTCELRRDPSEVRIAFLKESIIVVTCGSLQIVDGLAGALPVTPGSSVGAPGVREEGVPTTRLEVGRAINVGVAGACVAGDTQPANSIRPRRKAESTLVFIIISSILAGLMMRCLCGTLWLLYPSAKRKTPGQVVLAF
jgi:hypothetical protein